MSQRLQNLFKARRAANVERETFQKPLEVVFDKLEALNGHPNGEREELEKQYVKLRKRIDGIDATIRRYEREILKLTKEQEKKAANLKTLADAKAMLNSRTKK